MSLKSSLFRKLLQSFLAVSERERVTTRSKIVGMISFVREKFVRNMVENVREEIVVHVSSQLRRRGLVGGMQ